MQICFISMSFFHIVLKDCDMLRTFKVLIDDEVDTSIIDSCSELE